LLIPKKHIKKIQFCQQVLWELIPFDTKCKKSASRRVSGVSNNYIILKIKLCVSIGNVSQTQPTDIKN